MQGVMRKNRATMPVLCIGSVVLLISVLTFGQIDTAHGQDNDADAAVCDTEEGSELETATAGSFWEETNFCEFSIDFGEVISGGVGPDGIPPIDDPNFDSIEEASEWLQDQSPVIAFELDGEARAYPLAILTRHEIVNDVIGESEIPVAVTYCPLCNSAIVFERTVDGEVLRFGVSGFLRNSDLIMWDNETKSWWQQLTGEGIVGDFTGTQLEVVPSLVVGFAQFVEQFPEGVVLSPDGRNYGINPYVNYDTTEQPFLFLGEIDDRLDTATERVLAGVIDGEAIAYPFSILEEVQVINDTVGERDVVAFWQPGKASALDQNLIDDSRDVGTAGLFRRDVEGEILTFSVDEDGAIIDDQTGSTWNVFGRATSGELEGTQLRQELAAPHLWFAWAAFRPETTVYELDATE